MSVDCYPEMLLSSKASLLGKEVLLEVAATRAKDEGLHQGKHAAMIVRLFIRIDVSVATEEKIS